MISKQLRQQWKEEYSKEWFQFIFDNHELELDWDRLSANPNITFDIVQNNKEQLWSYKWLSENPNITWEIVQNNPDKRWNYKRLSSNPNITIEIVQNNNINPQIIFELNCIMVSENLLRRWSHTRYIFQIRLSPPDI